MRDKIKYLNQTLRASALCTGALLYLAFSLPLSAANQNQLDGVKQEISRQQEQLGSKQKKVNTLQKSLKQQELSIATAAKKIHKADTQLTQLNRSISELQQEQQQLQQLQFGQQEMLKELLNTQYRQGQHSQLATLLSGEDSTELDRMSVYAERLSEARANALDQLAATSTEIQLKKHQLTQQRQQQQTLLTQLKTEKSKLEKERQQRKKTVRQIKGQLKSDSQYLSELKTNEQRLIKEIAKAKAAAEAARRAPMDGLAKHKGKLPWPVTGSILHNYGTPQQGELRWKGMVISKPAGSKVKAVYSGKVVFADWLRGYGLMLVIDHGKGDMSFYGYNQTLLKKVGDTVQAKDAIALVGDSGGQERSGLYFEIRRKGSPINPKGWLTR
ncbi:peptidoglycan DD-metalloendopeptidase family protein [Photobacterium sp. SDRW27]|uniref:peptidoglycan DD-metalloendopeptidase family protein n=1 Tax=Photobacterium obscurum TaxID=2829490 RepID=UPI002242E05F|nr:peptidoglycan DD-metalloendopeptidase family protein [Photobacterium obscurum]MCW8329593.1 peptidoglycan DD-metalloendopeptidase family protein [Photobacterium obscurum]